MGLSKNASNENAKIMIFVALSIERTTQNKSKNVDGSETQEDAFFLFVQFCHNWFLN
jgi:hypothetical protein